MITGTILMVLAVVVVWRQRSKRSHPLPHDVQWRGTWGFPNVDETINICRDCGPAMTDTSKAGTANTQYQNDFMKLYVLDFTFTLDVDRENQ